MEEKLKHLAEHDVLTGLINRTLLEDRLAQMVLLAKSVNRYMAVCFLDFDGFKKINDNYGHHIGDKLLCAAASRIQACIREEDTLARIGGDELVLRLSYFNKENDITVLAERIIKQFDRKFLIENYDIKISLSMGIALYPQDGAKDLIKKADLAMYHVKKNGKNNFIFLGKSNFSLLNH